VDLSWYRGSINHRCNARVLQHPGGRSANPRSLRLAQVVLSFVIAGNQLGLFLWPTHVLGAYATRRAELEGLRQWLVLFATFALVAAAANWHALRIRQIEGVSGLSIRYEAAQRCDRVAAVIFAVVVFVCWALSYAFLLIPMFVGIVLAVAGSLFGLVSQARISPRLREDVAQQTQIVLPRVSSDQPLQRSEPSLTPH
jgi:hypothetical protein